MATAAVTKLESLRLDELEDELATLGLGRGSAEPRPARQASNAEAIVAVAVSAN